MATTSGTTQVTGLKYRIHRKNNAGANAEQHSKKSETSDFTIINFDFIQQKKALVTIKH